MEYITAKTIVSKWSENLWKVFVTACEKYGIIYDMKDIIQDYKNKYK